MPSRRRPKAPQPRPLTDAERFAQSLKETADEKERARQEAADRKAELLRLQIEAAEHAARLKAATAAHAAAVAVLKAARQNGRRVPEAEVVWRLAKADLLEAETGERPEWGRKPIPAEPEKSPDEVADATSVGAASKPE